MFYPGAQYDKGQEQEAHKASLAFRLSCLWGSQPSDASERDSLHNSFHQSWETKEFTYVPQHQSIKDFMRPNLITKLSPFYTPQKKSQPTSMRWTTHSQDIAETTTLETFGVHYPALTLIAPIKGKGTVEVSKPPKRLEEYRSYRHRKKI